MQSPSTIFSFFTMPLGREPAIIICWRLGSGIYIERDISNGASYPGFHQSRKADNRFLYMGPQLHQIGKALSVKAPLVYVETEYFGGTGFQGAVVWANGQMIFGPALTGDGEDFQTDDLPDGAINIALRKLGVLRGDSHDEFDAIRLGEHRNNEIWIEEMTSTAPENC